MSWVTGLQKSLAAGGVDVVPPGFLTVREIAKELGKAESHARHLVADWSAKGLLTRRPFKINYPNGPRITPHYCKTSELQKNFK